MSAVLVLAQAGCQSSSGGYFYAARPWEVDGLKIKNDKCKRTQTTHD